MYTTMVSRVNRCIVIFYNGIYIMLRIFARRNGADDSTGINFDFSNSHVKRRSLHSDLINRPSKVAKFGYGIDQLSLKMAREGVSQTS